MDGGTECVNCYVNSFTMCEFDKEKQFFDDQMNKLIDISTDKLLSLNLNVINQNEEFIEYFQPMLLPILDNYIFNFTDYEFKRLKRVNEFRFEYIRVYFLLRKFDQQKRWTSVIVRCDNEYVKMEC